ncbi:MAG: ketol-acid reductoisomerase [Candidatus Krumholzibacteriota bacterium]|nr:ketol-acid reductoisomerase [Candidatus Krumholzibacteriota bacterium]
MNYYSSNDADSSVLDGRNIVVLGYGNQGRPQALNLRDSGLKVSVAARRGGESWQRAIDDGFRVVTLEEGAKEAQVLILLIPDEIQRDVFLDQIAGNLEYGSVLCFAHGFSVAFREIQTSDYVQVLVAPKGQGKRVREAYLEGSGLPCLIGVENDLYGDGMKVGLAIAEGLGCLRVGAFETTFKEEAVSDIFGEQAVLCGGVTGLVKCAFDTLVSKGFSPEVAYFECMHELKILVDIFSRIGFSEMRKVISTTAAYGGLRYGEALIDEETGSKMEKLFEFIDSGEFARDWLDKSAANRDFLVELREKESELLIEKIGREIRSLFPENK